MANMISAHLQEHNMKVTLIHATGMAQRGGRVTSEIRFSSDINSNFGPRISDRGADFIIGMDLAETVNSFAYMKKGGTLLCNDYTLVPSEVVLKKKHFPDSEEVKSLFEDVCSQMKIIKIPLKAVNMFTLGAFVGSSSKEFELEGIFTPESFEATLKNKLSRRIDENLSSFREGVILGQRG